MVGNTERTAPRSFKGPLGLCFWDIQPRLGPKKQLEALVNVWLGGAPALERADRDPAVPAALQVLPVEAVVRPLAPPVRPAFGVDGPFVSGQKERVGLLERIFTSGSTGWASSSWDFDQQLFSSHSA